MYQLCKIPLIQKVNTFILFKTKLNKNQIIITTLIHLLDILRCLIEFSGLQIMCLTTLRTMNLLLCEDDEITASFLAEVLEKYFANVYVTHNGRDAFDIIQNYSIDLLMTDILMPYLSGIDLIEALRKKENTKQSKKLPIIVISARQDPKELLKIVRYQLVDYILKPITLSRLEESLRFFCNEVSKNRSIVYYIAENLIYDISIKALKFNGKKIRLTPLEAHLLEFFLKNKNVLLSKKSIMEELYGEEVEDSTIRNLLARLRKKIGKDKIISINNFGIKFIC